MTPLERAGKAALKAIWSVASEDIDLSPKEQQAIARAAIAAIREPITEALKPFADCCEQIGTSEDDEEWAKFRLLVKDYRRAHAALSMIDAMLEEG